MYSRQPTVSDGREGLLYCCISNFVFYATRGTREGRRPEPGAQCAAQPDSVGRGGCGKGKRWTQGCRWVEEDEGRVGDPGMGSGRPPEARKVVCGRRPAQEQTLSTRSWAGERTLLGERQGECRWRKGIRGSTGKVCKRSQTRLSATRVCALVTVRVW